MPELNERLAQAVSDRMRDMGWSQATVAGRGGPSTTSLSKITGGVGPIQPSQLGKLDTGLGWEPGTAARYLAGGSARRELRDYSNEELAGEVLRRMSREGRDAGNADAEKSARGGSPVTRLPSAREAAAEKRRRLRADADMMDEAAYDGGNSEPEGET